MTSQPSLQIIVIHILPNISQSKGNQTMKFGQQDITRQIFFFKNYAENETGKLGPDLFLFFERAYFEVKASGLQLNFGIF